MSVIIRGMEMPQSCRCCPMCSVAEWWCDATNKNLVHAISEETSKAEWCPLVEVPTPHGKLADIDRLQTVFERNTGYDYPDIFDNAPIVIEAEDLA